MDLKTNDRIIEVRTAYALNRIFNYINRKKFKEHVIILECLAESIDEDNKDRFLKMMEVSTQERIVGASKKEILATFQAFYKKPTLIASKMGISRSYFYNIYNDLLSRNFINDKFIEELKPSLSKDYLPMCLLINSFLDNFTYMSGDPYYSHYDSPRVMELEFYLIYDSLFRIYQGSSNMENFLYKICTTMEIDWSSISYLLRNIHVIQRLNNDKVLGTKQFKQELFNLGYLKGLKKYEIGKSLFGLEGKTFYSKSYDNMTKDITEDDWEFDLTFTPTVDWQHIKHEDVLKFIELFRSFVNEQL